jgi:hypothetical protein
MVRQAVAEVAHAGKSQQSTMTLFVMDSW